MKLIFLDIDGVLNCEAAYRAGECKYVEWVNDLGEKDHHQAFCSWSKKYLNKLIEETGAKIVISSTWRHSGIDFMRKVWEMEGMSGEIIGLTPSFRGEIDGYTIPRGCEIQKWLRDEGFYHINWDWTSQEEVIAKSGISNYIIIDDDSDMLYGHRDHFIHVLPSPRNTTGFSRSHYLKGLSILTKSITQITYKEAENGSNE